MGFGASGRKAYVMCLSTALCVYGVCHLQHAVCVSVSVCVLFNKHVHVTVGLCLLKLANNAHYTSSECGWNFKGNSLVWPQLPLLCSLSTSAPMTKLSSHDHSQKESVTVCAGSAHTLIQPGNTNNNIGFT